MLFFKAAGAVVKIGSSQNRTTIKKFRLPKSMKRSVWVSFINGTYDADTFFAHMWVKQKSVFPAMLTLLFFRPCFPQIVFTWLSFENKFIRKILLLIFEAGNPWAMCDVTNLSMQSCDRSKFRKDDKKCQYCFLVLKSKVSFAKVRQHCFIGVWSYCVSILITLTEWWKVNIEFFSCSISRCSYKNVFLMKICIFVKFLSFLSH